MKEYLDTYESFKTLAEILPDFIAHYDNAGRILYMNGPLLKSLNVELEAIKGRTPNEVWPDGRFFELQHRVESCIKTGQSDSIDITVPDFNGGIEYHNIRIVAESLDGKSRGCIIFGRNMTDRVLLEQNLAKNSQLTLLGQFAAGIAHEINNPLAIISGYANKLRTLLKRQNAGREELDICLNKIESTVSRMSSLTRSLILLTAPDSNDPIVNVRLSDLIHDAISILQEKLKKSGIQLTGNYQDTGSVEMECRRSQLTRVLFDLLKNAVEATENLPQPIIGIIVSVTDDAIHITIEDNGPPLPKETRLKLMQPFFTTKAPGQGTGLGLSVARSIAESHKGRLFFDESSANTRFVLNIPRKQPR